MRVLSLSGNSMQKNNVTSFKAIRPTGYVLDNKINKLSKAERVQIDKWIGEFAESQKGDLVIYDDWGKSYFEFRINPDMTKGRPYNVPVLLRADSMSLVANTVSLKKDSDNLLTDPKLNGKMYFENESDAENAYTTISAANFFDKVKNSDKSEFFRKFSWAVDVYRAIERSETFEIECSRVPNGKISI